MAKKPSALGCLERSNMVDLVVCIRCDKDPSKILDTMDSIRWSCNPESTRVMAAVDGQPDVATSLKERSDATVYLSARSWLWGVGLWSLLVESIEFAEQAWPDFSHFLSVDYDTLFMGKGADTFLLDMITSEQIGMIGSRRPKNDHWAAMFNSQRKNIEKAIGRPTPSEYTPGEGVQGGCQLLTRSFIEALKFQGFFSARLKCASGFTSIADDHLIPLWCRYCGLGIVDAGARLYAVWRSESDPRGIEKTGVKIYHPIKLTPGGCGIKTEWEIRNYFRQLRGQEPFNV